MDDLGALGVSGDIVGDLGALGVSGDIVGDLGALGVSGDGGIICHDICLRLSTALFFLHRLCANSAQRNMSCLQLSTSRGFCKMFLKIFLMALKMKKILFALLKSRLFSYQENDHTVDMIRDARFLAC